MVSAFVGAPDVATECVEYPVNPKNGRPASMISKDVYEVVMANAERLDSAVIYSRDFSYNLCVGQMTIRGYD